MWGTEQDEGGNHMGHLGSPMGGGVGLSSQVGNGYDSISNTTRKALVQLVTE